MITRASLFYLNHLYSIGTSFVDIHRFVLPGSMFIDPSFITIKQPMFSRIPIRSGMNTSVMLLLKNHFEFNCQRLKIKKETGHSLSTRILFSSLQAERESFILIYLIKNKTDLFFTLSSVPSHQGRNREEEGRFHR